jgi:inositol oxygenase
MEQWLIHALGKVLCLYGDPQWAVVGKIVFPEFFKDTPDSRVPEYQTKTGVYSEGCGLDNVDLSWGHEALYMIRTMFEWVRKFNPYDLYSKSSERPKLAEVKPYYEELVARSSWSGLPGGHDRFQAGIWS